MNKYSQHENGVSREKLNEILHALYQPMEWSLVVKSMTATKSSGYYDRYLVCFEKGRAINVYTHRLDRAMNDFNDPLRYFERADLLVAMAIIAKRKGWKNIHLENFPGYDVDDSHHGFYNTAALHVKTHYDTPCERLYAREKNTETVVRNSQYYSDFDDITTRYDYV